MAVGVGAGADRGVARRGHGVGVLVVAIRKVRAAFEEEIEAGGRGKVRVVAVEEVAAELVDDQLDDQLWRALVGVGTGRGRGQTQGDGEKGGGQLSHTD